VYSSILQKNIYLKYLLVIIAGIIFPYAFSPHNFKILIFISLLIYFYILFQSDEQESKKLSFIYGFFIFLFGVSWIFNSIYNFGGQNLFISLLLTLLFIFLLALIFVPIGIFINKDYFSHSIHRRVFIGSSIWVLLEWFRSNLFGGFPWLLLGHSQTGTYLEAIFPLLGTYLVSYIIVSSALYSALIFLNQGKISKCFFGIIIIIVSVITINIFDRTWITHSAQGINFSIIQANIKQEIKFSQNEITEIKKKFLFSTLSRKNRDLVIWPETAIPTLYHHDRQFFIELIQKMGNKTSLLSGTFRFDKDSKKYFNSLVLLNKKNEQFYDKRHLVPFGEFTPLPAVFGLLAKKLNIPMSNLSEGDGKTTILSLHKINIHPLICYEIAYPYLINTGYDNFGLILNISNDAWFGDSSAPYQHLQIAQVRALETQKYILRSANTGVSALISPKGRILDKVDFGKEGVLDGEVYGTKGRTPYMYFGDYPILMLIFLFTFFILKNRLRNNG